MPGRVVVVSGCCVCDRVSASVDCVCVSGMVLCVSMLHASHVSWGSGDYVIVCQCAIG